MSKCDATGIRLAVALWRSGRLNIQQVQCRLLLRMQAEARRYSHRHRMDAEE